MIGAEVVEVPTHEGENPDYQKNDAARCFHCKDELFTRIGEDVVGEQQLDAVAYGENADDAKQLHLLTSLLGTATGLQMDWNEHTTPAVPATDDSAGD